MNNNFLMIRIEELDNNITNYYIRVNNDKMYRFAVFRDGFITKIRNYEPWHEYMFAEWYRAKATMLMRDMLPANDDIRETIMKCVEKYFMEK